MKLPINIETFEQFSQWIEKAISKKEIKRFYDILLPEYEKFLKDNGFDHEFYIQFINYANTYLKDSKNLNKMTDEDKRLYKFYEYANSTSPLII